MSTSIEAARLGYGFALLPEEKIRSELRAGTLKELPIAGSERYAELYLVFADREHAGPGAQRLAEIIREMTANECTRHRKVRAIPKRGAIATHK
jgi:DNA-binding transcriptional LysR family regulator